MFFLWIEALPPCACDGAASRDVEAVSIQGLFAGSSRGSRDLRAAQKTTCNGISGGSRSLKNYSGLLDPTAPSFTNSQSSMRCLSKNFRAERRKTTISREFGSALSALTTTRSKRSLQLNNLAANFKDRRDLGLNIIIRKAASDVFFTAN
jgi:hypothetical protein